MAQDAGIGAEAGVLSRLFKLSRRFFNLTWLLPICAHHPERVNHQDRDRYQPCVCFFSQAGSCPLDRHNFGDLDVSRFSIDKGSANDQIQIDWPAGNNARSNVFRAL